MSGWVEWFPPSGDAPLDIVSGWDAPVRLVSLDGVGPVTASPLTVKSPSQAGETAVDMKVPPRTVTVQGFLQAWTQSDLWNLRASLSKYLLAQPVQIGRRLSLGRLRVHRDGHQSLEVEAVPVSVSLPMPRGNVGVIAFDAEFFCPSPWWRESDDTQLLFQSTGGFDWPETYPTEYTSNTIEQEVSNFGDVPAPIVARMYGDVTTPRIVNVTTGETIELSGNVPAGSYIEVNTSFGDKRVELVDGAGVRTSIMDRLNLALADFWQLQPGLNLVRFEAGTNTSGRAELMFRQRYAGL